MTTVINLLGGSGLGKSTTACGLFYHMKMMGMNVELVREYVKNWAWEGKKITPYDQPYIFGKQVAYESRLYGKVDYVVTDSPLITGAMYELFYTGNSLTLKPYLDFTALAEKNGVRYINLLLKRKKPFDPRGRYETEEQARGVDNLIEHKLEELGIPFSVIDCDDKDRVEYILGMLNE